MKVGDIVKPIRNNGYYFIGKKYMIYAPYDGGNGQIYWYLRDLDTGIYNNNVILERDLVLYSLNKKELEDRIKAMEFEIDRDKKMIEYINTEHKDEIEPNEFFAWYIVKIMESDDPQKKEKISKLLNSINSNINVDKLITI